MVWTQSSFNKCLLNGLNSNCLPGTVLRNVGWGTRMNEEALRVLQSRVIQELPQLTMQRAVAMKGLPGESRAMKCLQFPKEAAAFSLSHE